MNTENETGVKVPKGQINYNTVAGSAGLASFLGFNLKDWGFGGCGGRGNVGTAAIAESQLVAGLMAEIAKEKAERYADAVGINTFKEALNLVTNEREARQANDKTTFETLARFDKEIALNNANIECFRKEVAHEFVDIRHDFRSAIALEAERREAADDRIIDYGQCNYVRYKKVLDASELCPPVVLAARAERSSDCPCGTYPPTTPTTPAA